MVTIELDETVRDELVSRLQRYFEDELKLEIGSFDAQFLLDFFAEQVACHYYNQGLADALKAVGSKFEEIADLVYQLEQPPPPDRPRS
jgi:uncharacterized protein (DUF2164 family)